VYQAGNESMNVAASTARGGASKSEKKVNGNGSTSFGVRVALMVICPVLVAGIIALAGHLTRTDVHETPEQKTSRVRAVVHTELDRKIGALRRDLAEDRAELKTELHELKVEIRELRKEIRK